MKVNNFMLAESRLVVACGKGVKKGEGVAYEMVQNLFCKSWMFNLLVVDVSLRKHKYLRNFKMIYYYIYS